MTDTDNYDGPCGRMAAWRHKAGCCSFRQIVRLLFWLLDGVLRRNLRHLIRALRAQLFNRMAPTIVCGVVLGKFVANGSLLSRERLFTGGERFNQNSRNHIPPASFFQVPMLPLERF